MNRVTQFGRETLVRGLLLIIGIVGTCLTASIVACGEDVALFPQDNGVCLFDTPVELFGTEQAVLRESSSVDVTLFESPGQHRAVEQHAVCDFGRNQAASKKPVMYCYCPDWCEPCQRMCNHIKKGDPRIDIVCIKGTGKKFPQHIIDHAEKAGYPVQHWRAPSGKGAMHAGVKTLDELVRLSQCEPGETPSSHVMPMRVSFVSFEK